MYAAIYETQDKVQAYRDLKIAPYTNNIFGVYSDVTLELGTYLRLYFSLGVSHVDSFSLTLKKLSTAYTDSSAALNSLSIDLYNLNSSGNPTGYIGIRTQVTTKRIINEDSTTLYSWQWHEPSGNGYDRSVLMVSIPFQSFVIGTNSLDFEMIEFFVNGEQTFFSVAEQDIHNIAEAITEDPAPDLSIDPIEVPDASQINNEASKSVDNINTFITYFDIGGAMYRTLGRFSDYVLVQSTDGNVGHQMIVYIGWFSLAAIFIIWLVSNLKRRDGGG